MAKNTEKVEQVKKEETKKIKLSELIEQKNKLDKETQELLQNIQKNEYKISFSNKKILSECMKYLEKNSPWNAYTAAGLIMLYNNMSEQKEAIKKLENDGKTWDGIIKLRTANVTVLWKMLTQMTGTGFYAAKNFVGVMAKIGEDVSNAVKEVDEKNAKVREMHATLEKLCGRIENPDEDVEIDIETSADSSKTALDKLEEEVFPSAN